MISGAQEMLGTASSKPEVSRLDCFLQTAHRGLQLEVSHGWFLHTASGTTLSSLPKLLAWHLQSTGQLCPPQFLWLCIVPSGRQL